MTSEEKDNMLIDFLYRSLSEETLKVYDLEKEIKLLNDRIDVMYQDEEDLRDEISDLHGSIKEKVDEAYLKGWKQGAAQVNK